VTLPPKPSPKRPAVKLPSGLSEKESWVSSTPRLAERLPSERTFKAADTEVASSLSAASAAASSAEEVSIAALPPPPPEPPAAAVPRELSAVPSSWVVPCLLSGVLSAVAIGHSRSGHPIMRLAPQVRLATQARHGLMPSCLAFRTNMTT
jgi:hypothetical protein